MSGRLHAGVVTVPVTVSVSSSSLFLPHAGFVATHHCIPLTKRRRQRCGPLHRAGHQISRVAAPYRRPYFCSCRYDNQSLIFHDQHVLRREHTHSFRPLIASTSFRPNRFVVFITSLLVLHPLIDGRPNCVDELRYLFLYLAITYLTCPVPR
jgi:hypothetical protein